MVCTDILSQSALIFLWTPAPQNVCSRPCFWESRQHDQGLTLLQQRLLAAAEKTGQFGISIQRKHAMLPMTLQNIQLLGTTVEAGGHQKKWIVVSKNEDLGWMNELVFCAAALSCLCQYSAALLWCYYSTMNHLLWIAIWFSCKYLFLFLRRYVSPHRVTIATLLYNKLFQIKCFYRKRSSCLFREQQLYQHHKIQQRWHNLAEAKLFLPETIQDLLINGLHIRSAAWHCRNPETCLLDRL